MRKIKLRTHKKIRFSTKLSTVIVCIVLFTYFFLNYASNKVFPVIMKQAQIDCKKMAIVIIINSLNDEVLSILDDNMYNVIQNNDGEIQTIDFNPSIVNKFLSETTNIVSNNLKNLEQGNIEEISFDRAALASGLSSNMADYFLPEEAVFVGWKEDK